MGTLAKNPRKNIKNNAKNEKCVYWNDGFFLRSILTCFKNDSENEIFVQKLCRKIPENEKVLILERWFFFRVNFQHF